MVSPHQWGRPTTVGGWVYLWGGGGDGGEWANQTYLFKNSILRELHDPKKKEEDRKIRMTLCKNRPLLFNTTTCFTSGNQTVPFPYHGLPAGVSTGLLAG